MNIVQTQHPDLVARSFGFAGVFAALIGIGIWDQPEFVITPQQHFGSVELTLQVAPAEPEAVTEPVAATSEPEPITEPSPEPIPEPEPITAPPPQPVEPEAELKLNPEPEPLVEPKPVVQPEPERVAQELKEQQERERRAAEQKARTEAEAKARAEQQARERAAAEAAAQAERERAQAAALNSQMQAQLTSLLVNEIKSKTRYPRNAVRRKLEGTVMMEFVVQDGVVVGYRLEQSSGHKILDAAAQKLAQSMLQFNTGNQQLNNRILIPIKYELL